MENFIFLCSERVSTKEQSLRKKRHYWKFFCSVLSRIENLLCKSSYSVGMRENTHQKNSEYGPFSRSELFAINIVPTVAVNLLVHNVSK